MIKTIWSQEDRQELEKLIERIGLDDKEDIEPLNKKCLICSEDEPCQMDLIEEACNAWNMGDVKR